MIARRLAALALLAGVIAFTVQWALLQPQGADALDPYTPEAVAQLQCRAIPVDQPCWVYDEDEPTLVRFVWDGGRWVRSPGSSTTVGGVRQ